METTFFYVFAGNKSSKYEEGYYSNENSQTLDEKLLAAFIKLKNETEGDIKVVINPNDYDRIRRIFDISKLPAFGISDIDLELDKNNVVDKLPNLPSRFNIFKRSKRRKMLESSKFFPKVERSILDHSNDKEKIFFFIRDLHFSNKDQNLNEVIKAINKTANEIIGKKAAAAISEVKKKFLG